MLTRCQLSHYHLSQVRVKRRGKRVEVLPIDSGELGERDELELERPSLQTPIDIVLVYVYREEFYELEHFYIEAVVVHLERARVDNSYQLICLLSLGLRLECKKVL